MKQKFILSLCAVVLAATMLTACAGNQPTAPVTPAAPGSGESGTTAEQPAVGSGGEIVINFPSFEVGVNSTAPLFAENVRQFNELNAGRIRIEVEEIPGDQAFADKMTILLAANDLPHIINNKMGQNLLDMFVDAGAIADLTPYIDDEWRASMGEHAWEVNSRNGRIYAIPDERSLMGYYYNAELFELAGVTPAETWEEFWEKCEALLAAGITPLSMDTGDTAWLTNLWTGPILASQSERGFRFMTEEFQPRDYNFPEFIDTLGYIQRMFLNYTTPDAVGGKYENGANNFLSGRTAMLANGPWMIADFSDLTKTDADFKGKVRYAMFPNGVMHDVPQLGYSISINTDEATRAAAIEVIRFLTSAEVQQRGLEMVGRMPLHRDVVITDALKEANPLLAQLAENAQRATMSINPFQGMWFANVNDAISTNFPNLATGRATPEEIANILTQTAQLN